MIKAITEPHESAIRKMFLQQLVQREERLKLLALRYGSLSLASVLQKTNQVDGNEEANFTIF
jgi:hypothetical protein